MNRQPPRLAAACYARCANGSSNVLEDQLQQCRTLAGRHGLEIVATYRDLNLGGLRATDRPGLTSLLEDAKSGQFNCVIVTDFDRLTRSSVELMRIFSELSAMTVEVMTVDGRSPIHWAPRPASLRNGEEV